MKKFLFPVVLSLPFPAVAGQYMAYLGGSGDPPGTTTIFDAKIAPMGRYATQNGYDVSVAFDGGHSSTEALVSRSFTNARNQRFTRASYEAVIADFEQKLRDGRIRAGDKLMVVVDTHGSRRGNGTVTHTVSSGQSQAIDLNTLSGSEAVSLDRLQSLAQLAEEKNVRLAVMDFSCHSGASLPLANSRTCVVTASGPESFAYAGPSSVIFANKMVAAIRPGKNLEEVFLEARELSRDLGFPMISTPEGIALQNRLYPVLSRYLNFRQDKSDKLAEELTQSVTSGSCQQEDTQINSIIDLSREIERVSDGISLESFRRALTDYHTYRRNIQNELRLAGADLVDQKRRICYGPGRSCEDVPISRIMAQSPESQIPYFQRQMSAENSPRQRAYYQQMIDYYRNMKTVRDELLRQYPRMARYKTLVQNYPGIATRTEQLAAQVAVESRKVYANLYRRGPSNACREFTL